MEYISPFDNEIGGFSIGFRKNEISFVLGIILPSDPHNTSVHCEFDLNHLNFYRTGFKKIEHRDGSKHFKTITGWIHTHPHLKCFLSGTDQKTIKEWSNLDPKMLAIVIDVYQEKQSEKIKIFNSERKEVEIRIENLKNYTNLTFCEELLVEISKIYSEKNKEIPELFFPCSINIDLINFWRTLEEQIEKTRADINKEIDKLEKNLKKQINIFREFLKK